MLVLLTLALRISRIYGQAKITESNAMLTFKTLQVRIKVKCYLTADDIKAKAVLCCGMHERTVIR